MQWSTSMLSSLEGWHKDALARFERWAGTEQPWPKLADGDVRLVTKAKGIYKPKGTHYTLSVRQTLGSDYADEDPQYDGARNWTYQYHQEGTDPNKRDSYYTNRGLMACLRDRVPVGVLRQVSGKPNVRYQVLGLALVESWADGFFALRSYSSDVAPSEVDAPTVQSRSGEYRVDDWPEDFDASASADTRTRIESSVVVRPGQGRFRARLFELYGARCMITGCRQAEALEAAHIVGYRGKQTNHPSNGLVLRADIHSLFDSGLLAVDEKTLRVLVSPTVVDEEYSRLAGKRLKVASNGARPDRDALRQHRLNCRL